MTPVKRILFILSLFALTLNSCSSSKFSTNSIQKRKYTKGWFIKKNPRFATSNSKKSADKKKEDKPTRNAKEEFIQRVASSEVVPAKASEMESQPTNDVETTETRSETYQTSDHSNVIETESPIKNQESSSVVEESTSQEETKLSSDSGGMSISKKSFIRFIVFTVLAIAVLLLTSLDTIGWGTALLLGGAFIVFVILAIVFGIRALYYRGK